MYIPPSSTSPDIKDYIDQYINDRVEKLINMMHWDSDSYPTISQLNEFIASAEVDLLDAMDTEKLLPHWKSAVVLYTRNLAKEMYLLGLRDGRALADRNITEELLEDAHV